MFLSPAEKFKQLRTVFVQTINKLQGINDTFATSKHNGEPVELEDPNFRLALWQQLNTDDMISQEQVCTTLTHALTSKSQRVETCPIHLANLEGVLQINNLAFL